MQDQVATREVNKASLDSAGPMVRHFRQVVLWPVQVLCDNKAAGGHGYDALVKQLAPDLWTLVEDEFGDPDTDLQERHYREFVSFLPHVQRFLYGDAVGPSRKLGPGDQPLKVLRRHDVAGFRITLGPGAAPVVCEVAHIDLYFFHDIDAVILAFEFAAENLPLATVQDITYRFGRCYPPGWNETGEALHCPLQVEWLGKDGRVLASSDYQDRQKFMSFVGSRRAPRVASHWEFLLSPLVPYAASDTARLRFRQIEYYRMPAISYLVIDSLKSLSRADYVRLALAANPGDRNALPFSEQFLADFEKRHCYDRFFLDQEQPNGADTRFLDCGHAFTMVVAGNSPSLADGERGLLGEFRHQHFLLFMIAHFHKAALLMLSDRLVAATKLLDPGSHDAEKPFRREIFRLQRSFLRFTQRYYFSEVSDQSVARDIFRMHRVHLGTEDLYREVRSEIFDSVQYLDSNLLRRQSGSMRRLTVVTVLGLIGTTVTGYLGMNLIAEADNPLGFKIIYFSCVTLAVAALTFATLGLSQRLTRFFDWMSGEKDEG